MEDKEKLRLGRTTQAAKMKLTCGGIAGMVCPDGMTCVDDPSDSCDPANDGADCIGTCKQYVEPGGVCDVSRDSYYIDTNFEMCASIRFLYEPGYSFFADDCGCGCKK